MTKQNQVVLYLRSSKDRNEVSIDAQRRSLTEWLVGQGWVIADEYVDCVESAKTDRRPSFQAMMASVKQRPAPFAAIACYDTSRFSRSVYDSQLYKHLLKKNGVELLFYRLPKGDPVMDPMLEGLMEVFDQFHSQKARADGLKGMEENIRQGWRAGGRAPVGYKLQHEVVGMREGQPVTKSRLIPDPLMFEKVRAFMLGRARGEGRRSLRESLGLKVPMSTLIYAEDNAMVYAGHTVWGRHTEVVDGDYAGGVRYRDRDEWVVNRDTHQSMISDAESDAILARRNESRGRKLRATPGRYLLTGLLYCECGSRMNGQSGRYRCVQRCGARSMASEKLEQAIVPQILDRVASQINAATLRKAVVDLAGRPSEATATLINDVRSEIHALDQELSRLVALIGTMDSPRALIERVEALESRRELLQQKLAELEAPRSDLSVPQRQDIEDWLGTLAQGMRSIAPGRMIEVLRASIRRVDTSYPQVRVALGRDAQRPEDHRLSIRGHLRGT